ncbi:MAG: hypothetical protein CNC05_03490 [Pelagibacterales bacterium MED-G42]|nr:MAG: hypothetical protein CNC05_03490 [Pelagibacterales bacterium MED-G42]|tara:strand:- start:319 stop:831 length:513 start_codon:yes stop_codon:yes gene_type:complete
MSIIKNIILITFIFSLSFSKMSLSNELKKVGKFQDWETMILDEVDGKVCFAQTKPILQAPKSNKRESKLFVTFRPNDKISDEISITPGYEFNKSNSVTAVSGKYKFKFDIKQSGFAWITDNKIEIKMVRQMKRGSRIMITGYNEEGSQTIDHYSLLGFTKAYNSAKTSCN